MDGSGPAAVDRPLVTDADIRRLVHAFYAAVRRDELIGPIFNRAVDDWPEHLAKLVDFWASVMLKAGRYNGRPLAPHLALPIGPQHFDRWLRLFEATAAAELPAEAAELFVDRARRIADSFELAIGSTQGRLVTPRHSRQS